MSSECIDQRRGQRERPRGVRLPRLQTRDLEHSTITTGVDPGPDRYTTVTDSRLIPSAVATDLESTGVGLHTVNIETSKTYLGLTLPLTSVEPWTTLSMRIEHHARLTTSEYRSLPASSQRLSLPHSESES